MSRCCVCVCVCVVPILGSFPFSGNRYLCTDTEQDLQKLMAALVKAKVIITN